MPQANIELQIEWGVMDAKAERYLTDHGYILLKGWLWRKPSPEHIITAKEARAIQFLIDEWDFGGVVADDYQGEVMAP